MVLALAAMHLAHAGPAPCSVWLWVSDPDPKGINVRAAPSGKSTILGQLPGGTEITAIGAKEGWIQFNNPIAFEPENGREWEPRTEGPQTGWLHGSLLKTSLRDRTKDGETDGSFALYATPDDTTGPIVRWANRDPYSPGNDWGVVRTVLDCSTTWLKVVLADPKDQTKTHTGWVHADNQCPSQVTTCP